MTAMLLPRPSETRCAASIDLESAHAILDKQAEPIGIERVALERAGRRRLAARLIAQTDAPRCDVAAMDGYAVRSSELAEGCHRFRVIGASYAGAPAMDAPPRECAVRVTTGAPMPADLDQVIVWEQVSVSGDFICLAPAEHLKRHVRAQGSDFRAGAELLLAGRVIDPRAMVIAAAAGVGTLTVWRQPRVACLANGDELVSPGAHDSAPHVAPDSLSQAILFLARQWLAKPVGARAVGDNVCALAAAAISLLEECDVLVVIGGAAGGDRDFAKASLAQLGLSIHFADVAVKPGKPVWYGRIGTKHVLGLPGNPTAAMTTARLFLAPLLASLGGGEIATALSYDLRPITSGFSGASDREQFLCATTTGYGVKLVERQSASMQSTLADADVLVRVPAHAPPLEAGTLVQTLKF